MEPVTTKRCSKCKQVKDVSSFRKRSDGKGGLAGRCRECMRAYTRNRYVSHPETREKKKAAARKQYVKHRETKLASSKKYYQENKAQRWNADLIRRYGITVARYNELLGVQDGKCATCHRTDAGNGDQRLHVDHDHTTGAIRGLLCMRCNRMLGLAQENVTTLANAIAYLKNPPANVVLNLQASNEAA